MPDPRSNSWDKRRESNSSGWSDGSNPASINQRPRVPLDTYADASMAAAGMVHRNPFQNPSPAPSIYDSQASLQPPNHSFSNGIHSGNSSKADLNASANLSVSYLPSKFSRPLSPGLNYRKANKGRQSIMPRGGGRDAFATGASRMPGSADDDHDGPPSGRKPTGKLRWNRFKWILVFTNTVLTVYSLVALVCVLLIWFKTWGKSDVILVGNQPELITTTIAACACFFTSLVGWAGILLNNRSFLAVYTLLLWVTFGLLVVPGYITYKRRTFNLEGKINSQWSRNFNVAARLTIQNVLSCCGYFSPFIEATVSARCYSRSLLQGCKAPYLNFEREILHTWYIATFGLVPFHIGCILAALLCSNHVTYRFGKGMMPKAYRLNPEAMAIIMESFASNLADQYGGDVSDMAGPGRGTKDDRNNYTYPPNGSRSRDSSNSGHEHSPGSGVYSSYGSTSGLVGPDGAADRPYANGHRQNDDRGWDNKRL